MKHSLSMAFVGILLILGCNRESPKVEVAQPADSPKKAEDKKPQELIVGKWEGEQDGVPNGAEFTDKGQVIFHSRITLGKGDEKRIGGPFKLGGTYKFLDDNSLEVEAIFGKVQNAKYRVEVTKESLKLTSDKKAMAFKRVQDFSVE